MLLAYAYQALAERYCCSQRHALGGIDLDHLAYILCQVDHSGGFRYSSVAELPIWPAHEQDGVRDAYRVDSGRLAKTVLLPFFRRKRDVAGAICRTAQIIE